MKTRLAFLALSVLTASAFSLSAQAANIIDFEGLANGLIVDDEYEISDGVSIRGYNVDRAADNMAVIFDTSLDGTADPDLEAPFTDKVGHGMGILNPGNVLIIHEHPWECDGISCGDDPDDEGSRPAGFFEIMFDRAVTLNSIDFFDIELSEDGATPDNQITIFGTGVYDPFYTPDTGGDNGWDRLDFNLVGVTSLKIKLHGSGAIDNINYSEITTVPAPASLLLLVLGLLAGRKLSRESVTG